MGCEGWGATPTLVLGGVGTGKTGRLVSRVGQVLETAGPGEVAVFCASPEAARRFRSRLAACGAPGAGDVAVLTPRELAMRILASGAARALTGRDARLACFDDEAFLLEDLKTSGLREGRIREMVKFFRRSWTELADDDPQWLVTSDEVQVHTLLKAGLGLMGCVLEPEAANLARRVLMQTDMLGGRARCAHVFVDDYQMLSRASQQLCRMVAHDDVEVAADPAACVEVHDSYPYRAGVDEFAALCDEAHVVRLGECRLPLAVQRALSRVEGAEGLEAPERRPAPGCPEGSVEALGSPTPQEELLAVAGRVRGALDAGLSPEEVVVAVPNAAWAKNLAAALGREGVKACATVPARPAQGQDIHDLGRCGESRMLCALRLAADPRDGGAWRCWCGYGDYLANSSAFVALQQRAGGRPLADVLEELAETGEGARQGGLEAAGDNVALAFERGRRLVESTRGLSGNDLLDAIAREVTGDPAAQAPARLVGLCLGDAAAGNPDARAADMVAHARRLCAGQPNPQPLEGAVRVALYADALAFSPKALFVSGFVNGFFPRADWFDLTRTSHDKRRKRRAEMAELLRALVGKARESLVVSYFTSADFQDATRLRLKMDRIGLEDGRRVCDVSPSVFLAELVGRDGDGEAAGA